MPTELSASQAADVLQISRDTIWRDVRDGNLTARRQGRRGIIRIDVERLKKYADDNGYIINAEKLEEITR